MGSGPAAYDDGVLRITRTAAPDGLALAGEIDESTYSPLVANLGALTRGEPEVHLDLAGVTYCDLAGLRALVRLASPGRDGTARRRVVLHNLPAQLRAVLEIIGWDTVPGLTLGRPGSRPAGK